MSASPADGILVEHHEAMKLLTALLIQNPEITDEDLLASAHARYPGWRDLPYNDCGHKERKVPDWEWDLRQDRYVSSLIPFLRSQTAESLASIHQEWF